MSKIIMLLIGVVTFVLCQFPGGPHLPVRLCQLLAGAPRHFAGPGRHLARFTGRGALWARCAAWPPWLCSPCWT